MNHPDHDAARAVEMRFFRDLTDGERMKIFTTFGIKGEVLAEVRSRHDQRRLFKHLFGDAALADPSPASRPDGAGVREGLLIALHEIERHQIGAASAHDDAKSQKQRDIYEARVGICSTVAAAVRAIYVATHPKGAAPAVATLEEADTNTDPNHPMTKALRDLVRAQKLSGAVLLSFTADRVGINSSSPSDEFGGVMTRLGDLILSRFQAGEFDEALPTNHPPGQVQGSEGGGL